MKLDPSRLLTCALRDATFRREIPGAVCIVGNSRDILYRKAVGWRALVPLARAMRLDTLFDIASLTKVVATTSSVLCLAAKGKVRLSDPLGRFFREYRRGVKRAVTIRHLLLHTSGLPACRDYWRRASSPSSVIAMCLEEPLLHRPGEQFEYSDLGFILLGEIVERVAGEPLDIYAARNVFAAAGMGATCFRPPRKMWDKCAATEVVQGRALCGVVHDENARALGGVAGHAGLFSTADDLARFCQALLRRKKDAFVRTMIRPRRLPGGCRRALGWDIESPHASPKGYLFGPCSFGHTGFTGCSLWLDPDLDAFVVLLTNRLHLGRDVNINGLRSKVGTLAALVCELEKF